MDLFSVSKDGSILKFTKKKNKKYSREIFADSFPKNRLGHSMALFFLDISYDGKFLITAGKDKSIKIWEITKKTLYHTLTGHTQQINSLKFQLNSYEFFSGSSDG